MHINYTNNSKSETINEAINANEAINDAIKINQLNNALTKLQNTIKDNPRIKIATLQDKLKLSRATIQRQVKQLIEMNLVVYKCSNKTDGYFAVK
ncbi:MAG TPA: helix-turn-helix domain-containing protein [Clostridia bacterium]|nr:helix-turn-helix domain-containing protein [Clostridia bacterium]